VPTPTTIGPQVCVRLAISVLRQRSLWNCTPSFIRARGIDLHLHLYSLSHPVPRSLVSFSGQDYFQTLKILLRLPDQFAVFRSWFVLLLLGFVPLGLSACLAYTCHSDRVELAFHILVLPVWRVDLRKNCVQADDESISSVRTQCRSGAVT
jgi:hypothetical protein